MNHFSLADILIHVIPPCGLPPLHACRFRDVASYCCMCSLVASRRFPIEGALEKSVRAAGLPSKFAEHYASEVLKKFPGKPECVAVLSSRGASGRSALLSDSNRTCIGGRQCLGIFSPMC